MSKEAHLREIDEVGYTIIENAIDTDAVEALLADLVRLERELTIQPAENVFEGKRTWRTYNLLAHGALWEAIPVHPGLLPIVEGVLDPGCLVSSLSSIAIGPGESPQPIHEPPRLFRRLGYMSPTPVV